MTIEITERQEKILIAAALNESYSDKVGVIKKFLDDNFVRASLPTFKSGKPSNEGIVVWLDKNKQPTRTLSDVQLFDVVVAEFKDILTDKEQRDELIKNTIKAWYNNKINKRNSIIN